MWSRPYLLALASFLLIPVVMFLGAASCHLIDPEWALRTSDYEGNFRLLVLVKNSCLLTTMLADLALWVLTCFFLLKSKQQSYRWLPLAAFGPFGFIVLSALGDNAAAPGDLHRRFVRRLNLSLRIVYELVLFVAVWVLAFLAMVLKRDLMILVQAAVTGISTEEIIRVQTASSGMWAFSEGLEVLYLVVLIYLLWPIAFNFAARLPALGRGRR